MSQSRGEKFGGVNVGSIESHCDASFATNVHDKGYPRPNSCKLIKSLQVFLSASPMFKQLTDNSTIIIWHKVDEETENTTEKETAAKGSLSPDGI